MSKKKPNHIKNVSLKSSGGQKSVYCKIPLNHLEGSRKPPRRMSDSTKEALLKQTRSFLGMS